MRLKYEYPVCCVFVLPYSICISSYTFTLPLTLLYLGVLVLCSWIWNIPLFDVLAEENKTKTLTKNSWVHIIDSVKRFFC